MIIAQSITKNVMSFKNWQTGKRGTFLMNLQNANKIKTLFIQK